MTGALTWMRLSYRQQRWELILVALGVAVTAIGMLWFASQIDGLRAASPDCLGTSINQGFPDGEGPPAACQAILTTYYERTGFADFLLQLSFGAPFGMGVLLGAPLVAREIDGGTAQLAWSIGPSRTSWLLRRIAFIALFAVVALGVLAVTSEILAAAIAPERNLSADFAWFGRRGWLIGVRGVGALMLGMLVGAIIGRVLPAILAAILVVALTFTALSFGMDRWNEAEGIVQPMYVAEDGSPAEFDPAALPVFYGLETPDGEILSWSDAQARGLSANYMDDQGRMYASEEDMRAGQIVGRDIQLVIPGTRYPEIVAREGAVVAGLGLLALLGTALVVRRRRPI